MLHRNIAFKMATDAYRIPLVRVQLRRIYNARFAAGAKMLKRIAVTGLAGDSSMQERQPLIAVDRSGDTGLNRAHVASQASALHGKSRRRPAHLREPRLHVVTLRSRIPGNGRLKEIVVYEIQICDSQMARS